MPYDPECRSRSFFTQLNHLNSALYHLGELGFTQDMTVMKELNRMRGSLLGQMKAGRELSRINVSLRTIAGLSPGDLTVWYELETGWFTEGHPEPGTRPIYNSITTEQAALLLQDNPDRDLAHELMVKVPEYDN